MTDEEKKIRRREGYLRRRLADPEKWRERGRAIANRYAERHREELRERALRQYAADPQKYRDKAKRSYHKNPERGKACTRAWTKANPDKNRLAARRHRAKYAERNRAKVKEWVKQNPEMRRAQIETRRARKLNAPGRFTSKDIIALRVAQNDKCNGCDKSLEDGYTIDHKIALARGGTNYPDNLQLLCRVCNSRKGTQTMEEWVLSQSRELHARAGQLKQEYDKHDSADHHENDVGDSSNRVWQRYLGKNPVAQSHNKDDD